MKKKVFAMFLAVAMLVSILAVPAFAAWPFPDVMTTDKVRELASRELSQDEINQLREQYPANVVGAACDKTITEDFLAILHMKENRPEFDNAGIPDMYLKYANLYETIYPEDPAGLKSADNSVYNKAVQCVPNYWKYVVGNFGVTRAHPSNYNSDEYQYTVDAIGAVGSSNTMYICHFTTRYDSESFLLNLENTNPRTVGKTYTDEIIFIKLGNSEYEMENVGYVPNEKLDKYELLQMESDARYSFSQYHAIALDVYMTYGQKYMTTEEKSWISRGYNPY